MDCSIDLCFLRLWRDGSWWIGNDRLSPDTSGEVSGSPFRDIQVSIELDDFVLYFVDVVETFVGYSDEFAV